MAAFEALRRGMMSFAYVFARFPSLTQTFCFREVQEMQRQMGAFPIWSLAYPQEFSEDCPPDLAKATQYVPGPEELRQQLRSWRQRLCRLPLHVTWQLMRQRFSSQKGKYRLYQAAWLGLQLRAQGVTHVHTHFAGIGARTAWWLKKFYGITYSFTGHANDMFCPNEDPISLQRLVADAAFVVTVSDFSRSWLCQQCPADQGKIHRIYNGMALKPRCAQVTERVVPLVVSVGRAIEKKGFADLIHACSILHSQHIPFRCQIVGGGPLESVLRDQIESLGLEGMVELTGALPLQEVQTCLRQADVFALPCVTEKDGGMDNLPTVILEAMEAELPVVSTRLAAVPEMVDHGVTGLLVEESQPEQLAVALGLLLQDTLKRESYGKAGRRLAQERFSVEVTVEQLRKLVENALSADGLRLRRRWSWREPNTIRT